MNDSKSKSSLIWDLPLRCWHWLLAACIATSLYTGLAGGIETIQIHQYSGISVVALIVFRLTWGIWGALYARWRWYLTTHTRILDYFRGNLPNSIHTPPGIALVVLLLIAIATQSVSGLFMTDDIFFEGPLYQFASSEVADTSRILHVRIWQLIAALVTVHVLAHLVYALILKNPTPLSMFTGKKPVIAPSTEYKTGNLVLSLVCTAVTFAILVYYSL